ASSHVTPATTTRLLLDVEPDSTRAFPPNVSPRRRHTSALARPPSGGAATRTRRAPPWRPLISLRDAPGTTQHSTTTPSGWGPRKGGALTGLPSGLGLLVLAHLAGQLLGGPGRLLASSLGQGGAVGEEGDPIVEDLEETAMDADRGAPAFLRVDHDRARLQGGHDRLVVGEDADLAFGGAGDQEGRLARPHRLLGGDDVHVEGLRH